MWFASRRSGKMQRNNEAEDEQLKQTTSSLFACAEAARDSNHVLSCTDHANSAGRVQQVAGSLGSTYLFHGEAQTRWRLKESIP